MPAMPNRIRPAACGIAQASSGPARPPRSAPAKIDVCPPRPQASSGNIRLSPITAPTKRRGLVRYALAAALLLVIAAPAFVRAEASDVDDAIACAPNVHAMRRDAYTSRLALSEHLAADTVSVAAFRYHDLRSLRVAGGRYFYAKRQWSWGSYVHLYVRDGVGGTEQMLVNFEALAQGPGPRYSLDYYAPSNDGTRVAYGMTRLTKPDRKQPGVLRVVDVASREPLSDALEGADGAALSWLPDGKAFFYSLAPDATPDAKTVDKPGGRRIQLHAIGTDQKADVALVGVGVPGSPPMTADDVPMLFATPGSTVAVLAIFHSSDRWPTLLVAPLQAARRPNARWRTVAEVEDHATDLAVHGNRLFVLSNGGQPGSQVREVDARKPDLARAKVVVVQGPRVIRRVVMSGDALFTLESCSDNDRIRRLDLADRSLRDIALPLVGQMNFAEADAAAPGLAFEQWNEPNPSQFFWSKGGDATLLSLVPPRPAPVEARTTSSHQTSSNSSSRIPRTFRRRK